MRVSVDLLVEGGLIMGSLFATIDFLCIIYHYCPLNYINIDNGYLTPFDNTNI